MRIAIPYPATTVLPKVAMMRMSPIHAAVLMRIWNVPTAHRRARRPMASTLTLRCSRCTAM